MIALTVHVEERCESRVIVESGAMRKTREYLGPLLEGRKIALVTETGVWDLYGSFFRDSLDMGAPRMHVFSVPGGEDSKSLSTVNELAARLAQERFDRGDVIIAFGGGVILDLAGFLASLYMRGISYVSFPTTLLSQVDACVGGKVAVNHGGGRNLLGTFYHPETVLVDPDFLRSLDARDLKSGLAEVVKAAIIEDETLFQFCEKRLESMLRPGMDQWDEMIIRALRVKHRIIEEDEREMGPRMILNLGHTVGHALETVTHYNLLRHGESVAVGMQTASVMARRRGLLSPESHGRIAAVIAPLLPGGAWKAIPNATILDAMTLDKKKRFDRVPFVLPRRVGEVVTVWDVDPEEIAKALDEVRQHGPEDI